MVAQMYAGAIVTKVGPGGNLAKLQGEVYDAVGVRLVMNDTTLGRRDGVDSDSPITTPPSPCDADNAGAASLREGNIRCEDGKCAPSYTRPCSEGQKDPERMRRGHVPTPESLADLRGQLQEGGVNDRAQFGGRELCLPYDISRMSGGLKEVAQLLEDGRRGIFTVAQMKSISRHGFTHVQVIRVRQCRYPLDGENGRADHFVGMYISGDGPCEFCEPDYIAFRICRLEYLPELGAFAIILVSEGDFAPYIGGK